MLGSRVASHTTFSFALACGCLLTLLILLLLLSTPALHSRGGVAFDDDTSGLVKFWGCCMPCRLHLVYGRLSALLQYFVFCLVPHCCIYTVHGLY